MERKIGSAEIPYGLFLAPMAGVTDAPFRRMCRRYGAEYTVTEMISAKALWYHDKKTAALAAIRSDEVPCAVQIFGSEPEIMAYAARTLTEWGEASGVMPAAIDLNMGCPVPKVAGNGEGSALLKDPKKAEKIIAAVRGATKLPVTVKIRTGYTERTKNVREMTEAAIAGGADLLVVHGRTREMLYRPPVDLFSIAEAVAQANGRIPVIGNGGIFTAEDARTMLRETGCDGIMIARGACGNPFLFAEIRAMLEGKPYCPPSAAERLAVAGEQIGEMSQLYGEYPAILRSRKLLCWYSAGMRGAVSMRRRINEAETTEDVHRLIRDLLCQNEGEPGPAAEPSVRS